MFDIKRNQQLCDLSHLVVEKNKAIARAIKQKARKETIQNLQGEYASIYTEIKAIREHTKGL